jgi:NAD(P)-dependent dehydrogenase (short-subunit alcohol dehydrogenase family)
MRLDGPRVAAPENVCSEEGRPGLGGEGWLIVGVLSGKTAIVTGGARGIGWGITQLFAREGAAVIMMGRTEATLARAERAIQKKGGRALGVVGDIAKSLDVERVMDRAVHEFGRIDILVANAGINPVTPILEISEDEFTQVVNTNFKGSFLCVQRAARRMVKQRGGGRIVIVGSVDGTAVVPGEAHYGPTKAALMQLTRVAAVELAPHGVYVNCISPGWVETDLVRDELNKPGRRNYWTAHIPAKRIGTPEDIAQAALFLSRDDVGSFMAGAVIAIDGGHSLVLHGMEV